MKKIISMIKKTAMVTVPLFIFSGCYIVPGPGYPVYSGDYGSYGGYPGYYDGGVPGAYSYPYYYDTPYYYYNNMYYYGGVYGNGYYRYRGHRYYGGRYYNRGYYGGYYGRTGRYYGRDIDTEEDLQEVPIEAADTTVEVVGDTVDPVAGDMPEAEVIEVAATAEVVEATGVAEVTAVVALAEAIDLCSKPEQFYGFVRKVWICLKAKGE